MAKAVEQGQATVSTNLGTSLVTGVSNNAERQRVVLRGHVGDALAAELVAAQPRKLRDQVAQQLERHNALVTGSLAPASRGEVFAAVPRLAYRQRNSPLNGMPGTQQELALLERHAVLESVDLNLLAQPIHLEGFTMVEQGSLWEVYLDGNRTRVGRGDAAQPPLDGVTSSITAEDLARWLANALQHPARNVAADITPAHLRAFTLACVHHLVHDQHLPVPQLARHQVPLMQRLALHIEELREAASKSAFTQLVLGGGWDVQAGPAFEFRFDPHCYPVPGNKRYSGKFRFPKHFYPELSDLEDGSEEWRCAMALDEHRQVARWVRNLDSDPVNGFWLPTSSGRFYPDFVCELVDGRVFVAEYKGEHLRAAPKELQKGQVGQVWAARSGGKALFAMLYKLEHGMNLAQQIDAALAAPAAAHGKE